MVPVVARRSLPDRGAPLACGCLLAAACAAPRSNGLVDAGDGAERGPSTGAVEILVEPSDDGEALYDSMSSATQSIHMTMYLLNSDRFVDLLIAKKAIGVDVKVMLNETFPADQATNDASYARLRSAGVPVVWAPSAFTYTHEKCVIVDQAMAWIMTMNLDETSAKNNREYLGIDTQASDVAEAERLFLADYTRSKTTLSGDLLVAPANARADLLALVRSATRTLDVEDEEFSDGEIVGAVSAAAARGVVVHVVLSTDPASSAQRAAVRRITEAGAMVVRTGTPYIHAKAVVADGARVFIGSENLTTASLEHNRELGLITSRGSEVAKVEASIRADFAKGASE
jgi:cardiolipin synthase